MIRKEFLAWRQVTETLLEATVNVTEEVRDERILVIEQQLDYRDRLQLALQPPFSQEEQEYGQQLLRLEAEIQVSLAAFNKQIRQDITNTQAKKQSMSNYVNPYGKTLNDGTYYDTKQ